MLLYGCPICMPEWFVDCMLKGLLQQEQKQLQLLLLLLKLFGTVCHEI